MRQQASPWAMFRTLAMSIGSRPRIWSGDAPLKPSATKATSPLATRESAVPDTCTCTSHAPVVPQRTTWTEGGERHATYLGPIWAQHGIDVDHRDASGYSWPAADGQGLSSHTQRSSIMPKSGWSTSDPRSPQPNYRTHLIILRSSGKAVAETHEIDSPGMIILQALDLLQKLRQPGQVIRHSTGTFEHRRQQVS